MSSIKKLVALCRLRQAEAATNQRKSWWSYEANMLERDPTREAMVRSFLAFDHRLQEIAPTHPDREGKGGERP